MATLNSQGTYSGHPNYWIIKQDGNLIVRYNKELDRFGWDRLKLIAERTFKECKSWMGPGTHQAKIGDLDGILYIAFPIEDPYTGNINVCIETRAGFESGVGVKLSDIAVPQQVVDGQHRHGDN